jgi:glycosyltransferase involved in cell wall biosynthesis
VVTVHGVMARRDHATNLAQYVYLYTLGSRTFRKVNLVRCLTNSDAEEIMRCGCPSEKIRVIPSAVDTDLFRPENKQAENLIAWVGRFVQEKGLRYLVEAARLVVDQHKDVKFMLVGDGSLRRKIVSMVDRNGLSENVIFAGKLAHKEIAKTLQKATLFVLPSLREGMPFALLEAMACGVAVVGSHIPGISNVVTHEENGLLVPPENPEALANAILMLLNDESLRRRLGQNARRLMVEKYSWNIITNKIEKLYHEVLM